jgi:hypothetical protein
MAEPLHGPTRAAWELAQMGYIVTAHRRQQLALDTDSLLKRGALISIATGTRPVGLAALV